MGKAKQPAHREWISAFGDRLQKARDAHGIPQREMADLCGVTESAYAKYETRSPMPVFLLPRVCERLRVDCWYLLTGRMVQNHLRPDYGAVEPRPFGRTASFPSRENPTNSREGRRIKVAGRRQ